MVGEAVRRRLAEFYATLDLACELPEPVTIGGLSQFLLRQFGTEQEFWRLSKKLQRLKDSSINNDELIEQLASLIKEEPHYFLVLMHLHRQIRFTNLELLHLLFDTEQLDDLNYYLKIMKSDPVFNELISRQQKSTKWTEYIGPVKYQIDNPCTIASFKKVVVSYLGSEKTCWERWRSRILNDPNVPKRIAQFLIRNEDLDQLIRENSVIPALKRSMRIINVETQKRKRGKYGERRVSKILKAAGFAYFPLKDAKTLEELERKPHQQTLVETTDQLVYTKEKKWPAEDKRFDFVLLAKGKIQFVIETNYFTTSMSKIREVVRHYKNLREACLRKGYRLIYITDGIGWLKLTKTLTEMIVLDDSIRDPKQVPFLMNLRMFEDRIDLIIQQMT